MWGWLWSGRRQENHDALRAYYLLHVRDGFESELPSEADFQMWLGELDDEDIDFAEDMGNASLERLAGDEEATCGDFWDVVDMPELRPVWQTYQKANQSWGAVQWGARITAWLSGIPWW